MNYCAGRRFFSVLCLTLILLCVGGLQEISYAQDANTILLLHFEDSLTGAQGQMPTQAVGVSYTAGVIGRAAVFGDDTSAPYNSAGNINPTVGTLEFWIKPQWNGNDGLTYTFLQFGDGGGMLFAKDGANNLRSIFNRFSINGQSEKGVAVNIGNWQAGQWHHVAYTWSNAAKMLELYVDGSRVAQDQFTGTLPVVDNAYPLQIGAAGGGNFDDTTLDELKISNVVRSASEIARDYAAGLGITGLTINPTTLSLLETWNFSPALTATTAAGGMIPFPAPAATWSSSNATVATVDANGVLHAAHAGSATITATLAGFSASLALTVTAPVRAPDYQAAALDPFLRAPAAGYLYEMPVLIIRYLPTQDGVNVDTPVADYSGTLDSLKANIDQFNLETKFMLEEGSRYHGYKNPAALPSLGYRVVRMITVYEPLPPDLNPAHGSGPAYQPDYNQILTRFNAQHDIDDLDVREVWLWGYHHGNIYPVESDMSSPTTGDISNSARLSDDLPIYNKTYTLYNYNFTRSSNEAVHDHGHQLESILGYTAQVQDGNSDFFWHQFVGQNAMGQFITGRCGWTHMPPNTTQDYDYENYTPVLSDCEDWTPDNSGQKTLVSAATWGSLNYDWPYGRIPGGIVEHNWYVFMMQNMPGLENKIPYSANTLTNWWRFTGDWDNAVAKIPTEGGLHASTASLSGGISFEAIDPGAASQNVTFLLRPVGGGTPVTRTAPVNSGGTFSLLGIPRGLYDVRIKGDRNLAKNVRVDMTGGNATGANVLLFAGDANNDNRVDPTDFAIFVSAYNTDISIPGSGYDSRADFNFDGAVDPTDFSLFVSNYNTAGDN